MDGYGFQILVEAFVPELRGNTKYEHLNFFYMIVPPLTISYVDRMLSCKGKLGRRAKQNNTFTDDGFILGIIERSFWKLSSKINKATEIHKALKLFFYFLCSGEYRAKMFGKILISINLI